MNSMPLDLSATPVREDKTMVTPARRPTSLEVPLTDEARPPMVDR